MTQPTTIKIDNVEYIRKDSATETATPSLEGYPYVIIRSDRAGVFAGYLADFTDTTAELCQARRLWYWSGAATLSQLAVDGTSKPTECKFPVAVPELTVTGVLEVIPTSEKAKQSIESVKVWNV